MQRGVSSIRVSHRATRFVPPAGTARGPHPLSRGQARGRPHIPAAARAAVGRDPVGALRRAARSLTTDRSTEPRTAGALRPASIHWSTPRRALADPRSFRAVPPAR